ncbi:MAG: ABC transporter substrate-binding protein, partial [Candidatus Thorarchaeota archaeon]
GPFLDKIRYVYTALDVSDPNMGQVQALVDGDIDVMSAQIHIGEQFDLIVEAPNVEMSEFYWSGSYYTMLNCFKWPFNVSGFRKALHLALDKNAINDVQGTYSADSPISAPHPLSVESEMEHHYYEPEVAAGAALLESLGFHDIDDDNIREGPLGEEIPPIEVKFLQGEGAGPILADTANIIVEALQNLNFTAFSTRIYHNGYSHIYSGNYDIFVWTIVEHGIGLEKVINYWVNWCEQLGWQNSTFESLAEVALTSTDYNEVEDAVKQLQYMIIEGAPWIVVIQIPLFSAYRTDTFDIVEHATGGPHSFYTGLRGFNSSSNSTGDTLRWGSNDNVMYLSPRTSPSPYGLQWWAYYEDHMEMMHDSLARVGMDLSATNWLAKDFLVETHDDDSAITENHTRITVNIIDNATWSDGHSITANDVAFSINWFRDNFKTVDEFFDENDFILDDLFYCYSKTDTKVIFEFATESWWHWFDVCFIPIIPAHAHDQYNPDRYDPMRGVFVTPEEFNDLVTSGPFMPSEWVEGEYIEIKQNPYYWKNPRLIPPEPSVVPPPDFTLAIIGGVISAAAVIIVGGAIVVKKK